MRVSFRNNNVIYWNRLVRFITQFKEYRISSEQVNDIYAKLLSVQIEESKENKKRHIRNIRTVQEQKHDAVVSGKCPRCGHDLVLRQGKYGRFYGCSNYPHCKYTHQI
ncbi:MAG: topoisomerase DNA-binding C4 zinc finger domain-containing protein [Bacteroidales bacterium]